MFAPAMALPSLTATRSDALMGVFSAHDGRMALAAQAGTENCNVFDLHEKDKNLECQSLANQTLYKISDAREEAALKKMREGGHKS